MEDTDWHGGGGRYRDCSGGRGGEVQGLLRREGGRVEGVVCLVS